MRLGCSHELTPENVLKIKVLADLYRLHLGRFYCSRNYLMK
jgi:hypothetical protein